MRLKVYTTVVKIMFAILFTIFCLKMYFVFDEASNDDSYGVYFITSMNSAVSEGVFVE